MLWRSTASHPGALEALTGVGSGEISTQELFGLVLKKQEALEEAVLRLARELDERS